MNAKSKRSGHDVRHAHLPQMNPPLADTGQVESTFILDHFKMDFKFSVNLVWDLQFLKLRHPKNDELFMNSL